MMRNWGIRNLRALYALSFQITGKRGFVIRALIDDELAARGALTTAERAAKMWERIEPLGDAGFEDVAP